MKKLLALLLAACMILSLAACGDAAADDGKSQASAVADSFLKAIEEGDFATAETYLSEDLQNELSWDTFLEDATQKMEQSLLSSIQGYTPSDEVKGAITDWTKELLGIMVRSYEVGEVTEKDGVYTVKGKIGVVDVSGTSNEEFYQLGQDLGKEASGDYMNEHKEELQKLYQDEGMNAVYDKIFADLLPTMLPKITEIFEKYDAVDQDVELTVENQDGKYVITNIPDDLKDLALF